jgi:hypothetical protein
MEPEIVSSDYMFLAHTSFMQFPIPGEDLPHAVSCHIGFRIQFPGEEKSSRGFVFGIIHPENRASKSIGMFYPDQKKMFVMGRLLDLENIGENERSKQKID